MNTFPWLIRREFWENRAIWMIPAVLGGLLIFCACVGRVDIMSVNSPLAPHVVGRMFLIVVGLVFFLLMSIYSAYYLLECLYADRKDRSILFWKSLPVSDTQTVLSKLCVGVIVIPLVYFAFADLTSVLLAFVLSIRLHSVIGANLWQGDVWLQIQALWIYLIITTAIWYLPLAGWLLLVSAYAKRAVMLWSVLPPLMLYIMERLFLGTHVIASIIHEQFSGYGRLAFPCRRHRTHGQRQ